MNTIQVNSKTFKLNTENTSYLFKVDDYGHLEHIHYGLKVDMEDADALSLKSVVMYGNTITYDENNENYAMNILPQEIGTDGRGDFREPSILLEHSNSTVLDLHYDSYEIVEGDVNPDKLPNAYNANQSLIIHLKDEIAEVEVQLIYSVFYKTDVITRRMVVTNHSVNPMTLTKAMSYSLDLSEKELVLMSFYGGWANEFNKAEVEVEVGSYSLTSRSGFSSNATNPGFILRKKKTDENHGEAWGFNLIYSGNHYSSISRNDKGNVRIMSGISSERFRWTLDNEESFETPCAILTYSNEGLNGLSHHFHDFINEHIVRGIYKKKERPILLNSWEGFGFDFHSGDLLLTAAIAKDLGMELFVLDDGWFGQRNNDHAALGDYDINKEKLPGGLSSLVHNIHDLGMQFGLWFEPEAISPDSNLYRTHKDWAIENEYPTVYGRHELLLDLTREEVRDYIVENVTRILDENEIDYVKWDMNTNLTGVSGEYSHRYILGLYEILGRIFEGRDILLETCSAGGNRFDLGMLCYSEQIWASDNTDAIERIRIQKNLSYLYPLSVMGAHVNKEVGNQSLRSVPLSTRFNVAAFGLLGYELDLRRLGIEEKDAIRKANAFYKEHRDTFQYGKFIRLEEECGKESFEVIKEEAIVSRYRKQISTVPVPEKLMALGLMDEEHYSISERINGNEQYEASGAALRSGIQLNNLYLSTGMNEKVRVPLDYGSELYLIKKKYNQ